MIQNNFEPREQQIQVVIRLKPQTQQSLQSKVVYVSKDNSDELIVETPFKKQYFVFDDIADQNCNQNELYRKIGQPTLKSSIQGYNCCIFAYGQTGAGKTYSIFGKILELWQDIKCDSRGILPRMLSELFQGVEKRKVMCSYMQIYNEQIYDLLNPQVKTMQIRQNLKSGVFVQGVSQQKAQNYKTAMQILLKGMKNRKVASTFLNKQSSRSHTIFTIRLEYQTKNHQNQPNIIKRSKINVVDLAGSQRIKDAKVEGERLKQGCNINKSLHILGNVINALVESTKKKKYIPYRDSKLTYYLKDSLSGNSITKLLANIEPSQKYLGDTLSTLMFAKRAKILRMKVEMNLQATQTFESLRTQVRKLRSQLADAKFIQTEIKGQKMIEDQNINIQIESRIWEQQKSLNEDLTYNDKSLQLLQQNEINYKALIEIYQERLKRSLKEEKQCKNMHREWKNLQKQNESLKKIIKNYPSFSKIFRENLYLKNDLEKQIQKNKEKEKTSKKSLSVIKLNSIQVKEFNQQGFDTPSQNKFILPSKNYISKQRLAQIIQQYEQIIHDVSQTTKSCLVQLQVQFKQLERQNHQKDNVIAQLKKRKQQPKTIQAFIDQIQYLKLNILQLEEQLSNIKKQQFKNQIAMRLQKTFVEEESNIDEFQKSKLQQRQFEKEKLFLIKQIILKLDQVKNQAQMEEKQAQSDRNMLETIMVELREEVIRLKTENKKLQKQCENVSNRNRSMKKKLKSYSVCNEDKKKIQEDLGLQASSPRRNKNTNMFNDQLKLSHCSRQKKPNNQKLKSKTQKKIQSIQNLYNSQLLRLNKGQYSATQHITAFNNQSTQLQFHQNNFSFYLELEKKSQAQFKKTIIQIIDEYRKITKKLPQQLKIQMNRATYQIVSDKIKSPYHRDQQKKSSKSKEIIKGQSKINSAVQNKRQTKMPPKFKF